MQLENLVGVITAALAVLTAIASMAAAIKSGVLKSLKLGPLELETNERAARAERYLRAKVSEMSTEVKASASGLDFETEQLERYYSQILSQSKISFWFSLVFASLGFAVIVLAAVFHKPETVGVTVTQVIAGVVMDAVSSLFFIQSRRAHEAMASFFEKLRKDRLHAESRRLCDEVSDARIKDALRVELILHYAEIPDSSSIAARIIKLIPDSDEPPKQPAA